MLSMQLQLQLQMVDPLVAKYEVDSSISRQKSAVFRQYASFLGQIKDLSLRCKDS